MTIEDSLPGRLTLQEILSQPEVWRGVGEAIAREKEWVAELLQSSGRGAPVLFTGCGSSYYIALSAASTLQHLTGNPAWAVPASQFLVAFASVTARGRQQLLIPISRSGESTETVLALEHFAREAQGLTLAVTCDASSGMAGKAQRRLVAAGAAEQSVVMTRSFTSQLLALQCAAGFAAHDEGFLTELEQLPQAGRAVIERYGAAMRELAGRRDLTRFVFLGSGPYYGLACEAALKMREMAIVSCSEYYHALEYRHGPMSTVDESTLIVLFALEGAAAYEPDLISDMKAKGARTLVICEQADGTWSGLADFLVELSSGLSDYARTALYLPPLQLLAFYRALHNGQDPDNPRNLTQVVRLT